MSGEVGSSGGTGGDEEDRKGKRTKYSDDEQDPFSDLPELNDDDLSSFQMFSEMDGTSLDELTKQQQQAFQSLVEVNNPLQELAKGESPQEAFQRLDQVNNPLQKSAKGESAQKESDGDAQIGDYVNYSKDSDAKKEDLIAVEEPFFEIEISDRNRLVIPYATASNHFHPMLIQPNAEETIQLYDPLSASDVAFGRMEMPGVKLPSGYREQEMVKLTDVNKKDWYVIIKYSKDSREYMIFDGWEGIVEEHKLEVGDMVRLYKPVDSDNETHFLIAFVKKKTEKEEGDSGSGKPDDGAGPSSIASFLNLRKKSHMSATVPETPLHHFFSQFEN